MREYDQPFLERLAAEIDALPADSAIGEAMLDYRRQRDQLRTCVN